jgi:hypothetical protein
MKIKLFPYSVTVLLAAALVMIPPLPSTVQAQTQTLRVNVLVPLPGQPIILPPEIPRELRGAVFMALMNLAPGQSISIDSNSLPPEPPTPPIWPGLHGKIAGVVCIWWTVVIFTVVVAAVIVYTIYKLCQLLSPPKPTKPATNALPYDPYPA